MSILISQLASYSYLSAMSSYLHTLQNLQQDHSNSDVVQKTSLFTSYEDYLHRRSRKYLNKSLLDSKASNYIQVVNDSIPMREKKSQIKYYPRNQKIIEYQQVEMKTTVPKKRIVTNYVEKKQVELVPKEVIVTDYYAVEHVRSYIKETIPEVKIQKVTIPKTIKNVEIVPVEKQIIYYPNNKSNMEQIKRQATEYLTQQGVLVRQDAEFKPQTMPSTSQNVKVTVLEPYLANAHPIIPETQSRLRKLDDNADPRSTDIYDRFAVNSSLQINKIPTYKRQNYKMAERDQQNIRKTKKIQQQKLTDYSFAERDKYRYELLTNSYFGKNY